MWQDVGGGDGPQPTCKATIIGHNIDVPNNDAGSVRGGNLTSCTAACCASSSCAGALFEPVSPVNFGDCVVGEPCCFLKTRVGSTKPLKPPTTGTAFSVPAKPQPNLKHPPQGIRSSPALGGLGAGSVELRADGSFREWTIFNQGPAGSGKYGIVDDVMMASRINNVARMLRTHPPAAAATAGRDAVAALNFSGTYPVTRLQVLDDELTQGAVVDVYAYSKLKPTDLNQSAHPAMVMSLRVSNPTDKPITADFMFTLPAGAWTDCSRDGNKAGGVIADASPAQCMQACSTHVKCLSWELDDASASCTLNTDLPLTAHRTGSHCGVRNQGWAAKDGAITFTQNPQVAALNPATGDMTLRPVVDGDVTNTSFISSNDLTALYQKFAANGNFGALSGSEAGNIAAHGAVSVSVHVPAGGTATASIVFAWSFPNRNYRNNIFGNFYSNIWPTSAAVAKEFTSTQLANVVQDINAHHYSIASPDNPTPAWLKDMLINQFSHFHMMMWFKGEYTRLKEHACLPAAT